MPYSEERIRGLIRAAYPGLSEEEVARLERELRELAEILLEAYARQRKKSTDSH